MPTTSKPDNLELWNAVFKTDPSATKSFKRAGGFGGTAIKPFWLIKRATEQFGPIGQGWGWDVNEDRIEDGADGVKIWFSSVTVWYVCESGRAKVGPQWGATEFVQKRSGGFFTDEEAGKKSVTDAITKCLSYIGFAGDVHMGQFDDSKYVDERKREEAGEKQKAAVDAGTDEAKLWRDACLKEIAEIDNVDDLKSFWNDQKATFAALGKKEGGDKAIANYVKANVERRLMELRPADKAA